MATIGKLAASADSTAIVAEKIHQEIDSLTAGTLPYFNSIFKHMAFSNPLNAHMLCQFVIAEYNEQNVKLSTRLTHIKIICSFSKFLTYKNFLDITKQDVLQYLSALRKTESEDPSHKWIGTYNTRQMVLSKFLKWLYNQNEPDYKKRITPACMQGVKILPRKEKSPYTPSDIWTNEEHAIFLKYCPEKRDKCYHSMANDTSCRPHELLSLRIKDIIFKMSSSGIQYAEVHIPPISKTGSIRIL